MKKILYFIVVFGIVGFGLFMASSFQKQKCLKICQNESSSLGGIESCMEHHRKLDL